MSQQLLELQKEFSKLFETIIIAYHLQYWSCLPQVFSCEKQASWCSELIKLVKN
jgi:hypothetical protein